MNASSDELAALRTQRPWLALYPPGTPVQIDADAFASLVEMFERSCAGYAERPAFANLGRTLTYAELDRRSRDFAAKRRQVVVTAIGDELPWPKRALVNFVVRRIRKLVPAFRIEGALGHGTVAESRRARSRDRDHGPAALSHLLPDV